MRRELLRRLRAHRAVALVGARQVGKTTLAREVARQWKGKTHHFDLEDPVDVQRLADPGLALRPLEGLVVLDEIQRAPEIFPLLRVLVDRPRPATRFLVLGSASPELLHQSSESLAGRISYLEMDGFVLDEVGRHHWEKLWVRGGFPKSFLARSASQSVEWRRDFIRSFLERDIPMLGFSTSATTLRRFWTMVAHYHGQLWSGAELARALGCSEPSARRYLDLLTSTFVLRQLQPFHANLRKRQVKSPKVYLRDSGLLHTLLGIDSREALDVHPKIGASWEGFLIEQILRTMRTPSEQVFFWATHGGAELDLLIIQSGRRVGFEFKRTESPSLTPSMRSALKDLDLHSLTVVHGGRTNYELAPRVRAVAVPDFLDQLPRRR